MSTRVDMTRRLDNAIRANQQVAAAQRQIAVRYPQLKQRALRAAAKFARIAEAKSRRRKYLLLAAAASGRDDPNAERRCLRCGRTGRRAMNRIDTLLDGTERWRCRNAATCRRNQARAGLRGGWQHSGEPA